MLSSVDIYKIKSKDQNVTTDPHFIKNLGDINIF